MMTPELGQALRASVASGEFASTSEALRDAVRVRQREREEYAERMASIRNQIYRSVNDGRPVVTGGQIRKRLSALHAKTVTAHEARASPQPACSTCARHD
ncbi:ribbon-helix-helix domain-containing protein [Chelatococcus reniformis]|nr:type II toxin-antitoxin system ParD family antitoxin [Chelatococcus reniformis]